MAELYNTLMQTLDSSVFFDVCVITRRVDLSTSGKMKIIQKIASSSMIC